MSIQIYNSLTRKKEDLPPVSQKKTLKIYTCGVTVYDQCHIGHARSLYVFDVIRRYLRFRGYNIQFVRNITDVDDKIIQKAKDTKRTFDQVVQENVGLYEKDLKSLGIEPADQEPRATKNIGDMIKDIQGLIEKGLAYEIKGDVYFDVRKFKDYGKLSGQSIEKMMEGVRIDPNEKKKDPLDFALWKKSREEEPFWDSPWGGGRPGWHIECSCMSRKFLETDTLDIHAGGRDLIFPHHENEIAQAQGLTGKPFAKYWLHHGLLTINGQKMAKSSGNFITIQDALKKYPVDDLKMFFLSSHYASPVDFSFEALQAAHKALERFDILFWKVYEILKEKKVPDAGQVHFIEEEKNKFFEAMDDDFNTPRALGHLFDLISHTNKFIDHGKKDKSYEPTIFQAADTIETLGREIFGLFQKEVEKDLSDELKNLLQQRQDARLKKDYRRSDELRDLLKQKGVVVEDVKQEQTWRWA